MIPVVLTTTDASGAATYSSVFPTDTYANPFNVGFGLVVTGTVSATVQHTFDNPLAEGFVASSATWFDHPSVAGATASADGNYAFPVRGIRVKQASGSGSTSTTFVQSGIPGR